MNSLRAFLSLLNFTAKSIPITLGGLPAISVAMTISLNLPHGEYSGFKTLTEPMMFLIPMVMGIMFFTETATGNTTAVKSTPLPFGEFLFVRPILRKEIYLTRIFLYFILMLAAPLVNLGLASRQPAMELSLFRSPAQQTEAAKHLALYQVTFPNSSIIYKEKKTHGTLVIPAGYTLIAAWELFITMLLALAIQTMSALNIPGKMTSVILIFLMFLLCFPPLLWEKARFVEYAFFFFVGHHAIVGGFTFILLAGVQWFAANRVQEMEVI